MLQNIHGSFLLRHIAISTGTLFQTEPVMYSMYSHVFYEKRILKNETPLHVFFRECCKIFQNIFIVEHPRVTAVSCTELQIL